jgi:hypothetical protein
MNQSSRNFLDNNRHHHTLLIRAGYMKHVDHSFKEGLLGVIRIEFQAGYNANLWCGDCVADMIKFAYTQYDKYLTNEKTNS